MFFISMLLLNKQIYVVSLSLIILSIFHQQSHKKEIRGFGP